MVDVLTKRDAKLYRRGSFPHEMQCRFIQKLYRRGSFPHETQCHFIQKLYRRGSFPHEARCLTFPPWFVSSRNAMPLYTNDEHNLYRRG